LVFAPEREVLVPDGMQAFVEVPAIAAPLEGRFRPGHFRGVATIVTKLFALGGPCVAPFGRKDYQQWRLVERLARDLFPHVEVVGVRTVREDDGLAMSSRNRYLDATQRERARGIVLGLRAAHAAFAAGERRVERLERCAREPVEGRFDAIDYVAVVDPESLQPLEGGLVRGRALLAVAARLGTTRLIDNTVLGEEPPP
ncbi:MAG: pantoate--beta-alanine ligase, partial [Myxococcota bacterium]|nr:pantoate--beta-alanine ligase [Myxococcota bacterium]